MVSIHRVPADVLLIISMVCFIFRFKRGASSVTRFTCWGPRITLSVETSNAESPTMIYIANTPEKLPLTYSYTKGSRGNVYTHHRASPLLCFWQIIVKLQSSNTSKPKRTVTPFYVYVPIPYFTHSGFQQGYDNTNVEKFYKSTKKEHKKRVFSFFTNKICTSVLS